MVTDDGGQPRRSRSGSASEPGSTGRTLGTADARATACTSFRASSRTRTTRITVRRIGYEPQTRDGVVDHARPDAPRRLQALAARAATLEAVTISGDDRPGDQRDARPARARRSPTRRCIGLPTLNRNFADFVQLVPQVSTTTGLPLGRRRQPAPERHPDRRRAVGRPVRPRHDRPAGRVRRTRSRSRSTR